MSYEHKICIRCCQAGHLSHACTQPIPPALPKHVPVEAPAPAPTVTTVPVWGGWIP